MTIKSLLLGSAAALVAVSGARAADAVVAEPEPVEYVRVCDAYGEGFFYIPGTETCLSISGYVYMQLQATNDRDSGGAVTYTPNYYAVPYGGYNAWVRARINFDARSDTEWGTLRGYVRLQADKTGYISNDGVVGVDQAYIELGGLRMGYTESAWVDAQNGGVSSWGSHSDWGMNYAYQQRDLISYTFTSGGFHGTLALEDDNSGNWVPDVVGVLGYDAGWGGVWAKVAYDEAVNLALNPLATHGTAWNASLGAQFNIPNMNGSNLRVLGFYASDDNDYDVGGKWSVLASYNHVFTNTFSASLAYQYIADTNFAAIGNPKLHQVELEGVWTPVKNFEVRSGIAYTKATGLKGSTAGFVRFTRYF